jgi:hypothetical protein
VREDPFPGVSDAEMEQMISRARLGRINGQIARMRLIDGENYADIAASFDERDHISRTTASRRMRGIIAALNNAK